MLLQFWMLPERYRGKGGKYYSSWGFSDEALLTTEQSVSIMFCVNAKLNIFGTAMGAISTASDCILCCSKHISNLPGKVIM